jgi:hypothetical protein
LDHLPVTTTSGRITAATTRVRMAMARSESTPLTPTLANSAVSAANTADSPAQSNHCGTFCTKPSLAATDERAPALLHPAIGGASPAHHRRYNGTESPGGDLQECAMLEQDTTLAQTGPSALDRAACRAPHGCRSPSLRFAATCPFRAAGSSSPALTGAVEMSENTSCHAGRYRADQYLDRAMATLRSLGLAAPQDNNAPAIALVSQLSTLDQGRVVAIARVLQQSGHFNAVMRDEISSAKVSDRYTEIIRASTASVTMPAPWSNRCATAGSTWASACRTCG